MNNIDPCSKKYFLGKVFGISAFHRGSAGVIPSDSAAHRRGYKASLSEGLVDRVVGCVAAVR